MSSLPWKSHAVALIRFDTASPFFVVTNENNVTIVSASLLPATYTEDEIMNDLRIWHDSTFPDGVLIDRQLDDPSIF